MSFNLIKKNTQVDTSTILLADVSKDAFSLQAEYFVLAGTQEAFNNLKQEINLAAIELLTQYGIRLASKETGIILKRE